MESREIEEKLVAFLEHYEQHRESYKEWTAQQIAKTAVKNIFLLSLPPSKEVVSDDDIEKQIVECGLSKVPEGQLYWEGAVWMRSRLSNVKEGLVIKLKELSD